MRSGSVRRDDGWRQRACSRSPRSNPWLEVPVVSIRRVAAAWLCLALLVSATCSGAPHAHGPSPTEMHARVRHLQRRALRAAWDVYALPPPTNWRELEASSYSAPHDSLRAACVELYEAQHVP